MSVHALTRQRRPRTGVAACQQTAASTPKEWAASRCILDADGLIVTVDEAWRACAAAFGFDTAMFRAGASYFALWSRQQCAEQAIRLLHGFQRVASGELPLFEVECCVASNARRLRVSLSRVLAPGPTRVIALHETVTVMPAAEESMRISQFCIDHVPNRTIVEDHLRRSITVAAQERRAVAVLHLNLDQFKVINESLGYATGDLVLAAAASRLTETVGPAGTVGRLDADNFIVICCSEAATVLSEAAHLSRRLLNAFAEPLQAGERKVHVSTSIGVALFPRDGDDVEALLRHANAAVHELKEGLRCGLPVYTPESDASTRERLTLEAHLRMALAANELRLEYQPQVDLRTGAIYSLEALLRWEHPELGNVSPARIIPLAEETGLIVKIGEWVLRTACAQAMRWQAQGLPAVRMSINVSARQMHGSDFVSVVKSVLQETGLPPELLELELTETVLLEDLDKATRDFRELQATGVRLALDDFGTGYSSLSYLKRCPVDTVKIDKSFIHDAEATPEEVSITRAVINMAHALNLMVVAEGVETDAQLALLLAYQCDAVQGNLVSASARPERIEELLRAKHGLSVEKLRLHRRRQTLLLIDDEENILSALRRLLRKDGYHILTARGATEALEVLAQNHIDVIVSDQRMPGMSGVELLRRAKELFPETIRIVLSGFTELQSITDAVNEGAIYKFLTKPWDDAQLRAHIAEAFRNKEMADENRRLQQALRAANRELEEVNAQLTRVLEGQRQTIELGETRLDVTREVLDGVPVAVLGVDSEGLVVFSNEAAVDRLGAPALDLGGTTVESLAPQLRDAVKSPPEDGLSITLQGQRYRAFVRTMGSRSRSHGVVVALFPEKDEDGHT